MAGIKVERNIHGGGLLETKYNLLETVDIVPIAFWQVLLAKTQCNFKYWSQIGKND